MTDKAETLVGESRIRPKNQVTIPPEVCEALRVDPGDFLRWELQHGVMIVCKSVTRRIGNNVKRLV